MKMPRMPQITISTPSMKFPKISSPVKMPKIPTLSGSELKDWLRGFDTPRKYVPNMPSMPKMPSMPSISRPTMPAIPAMHLKMPQMPNMPDISAVTTPMKNRMPSMERI